MCVCARMIVRVYHCVCVCECVCVCVCCMAYLPSSCTGMIPAVTIMHACVKGMEQVVPGLGSPLELSSRQVGMEGKVSETKRWSNACQRSLPQSKQGLKPLDLFSGDEIFANHEE